MDTLQSLLLSAVILPAVCRSSCDTCVENAQILLDDHLTAEGLAGQAWLLDKYMCPQRPQPEECSLLLPQFWPELATVLWPLLLSPHILCSQLCPHHHQFRYVGCDECEEALNLVGDYIESEQTIRNTIEYLQSSFCPVQAVLPPADCVEEVGDWLGDALNILVESGRDLYYAEECRTLFHCQEPI